MPSVGPRTSPYSQSPRLYHFISLLSDSEREHTRLPGTDRCSFANPRFVSCVAAQKMVRAPASASLAYRYWSTLGDSSLRWTGRISVVWLEVQAGRAEAHIQIPAGSPRRNTSRPLLPWRGQNLAEASATAQRIAVAFGEAQTGGRDRAFFYRASKQTAVAPGRDR